MSNRVYSTEHGQLCRGCQRPVEQCHCRENQLQTLAGDGNVRIHRETKGRKGKGVTLVKGLALNTEDLQLLGKTLKQHCGSGGAIKNGNIEIQGDHREKVQKYLLERGITAKLSGG